LLLDFVGVRFMLGLVVFAMLQVQEAENKLNVPKDAKEQPHDVSYILLFSISYFYFLNFFARLASLKHQSILVQY